jgi:hypothetical protein
MKSGTRRYLRDGMKVVKDPGSVACMADALASDTHQSTLLREVRRIIKRESIDPQERIDELGALLGVDVHKMDR